jgi:chemotaxis protein histidine kinase CheA/CheY-like chemotaxis protein
MTPRSPGPALAPSLADRLATLAGRWQNVSQREQCPKSPGELDSLRDELNALALEAEAADQASLARALRQVALLSELWECLVCEPDQAEAAAEVTDFCESAIDQLVSDLRTGSRGEDAATCDEIVRQSEERWSDYLSLVVSTGAGWSAAEEPEAFEEAFAAQDDAPPALDHETLLRLLHGSGDRASRAAPREVLPEPPRRRNTGNVPGAEVERSARADEQTPASATQKDERNPAGSIELPEEPGLDIPPLPARFDLDDDMKDAFLADAIDLFERIEGIIVGLGSLNEHRDAIRELGRCFHTLKGAAGSVGLNETAALVHELEERLGRSRGWVSPALSDRLHQAVDYLDTLIGWLRRGPAACDETSAMPTSGRGTILPPAAVPVLPAKRATPAVTQTIANAHVPPAEGPIRVPAARFDELTDLASDLIVQGRFWLSQADSMKTFAASVQDCRKRLLASLNRLHDVGFSQNGRRPALLIDSADDFPAQLRGLDEQADDLASLAAAAHAAASPMTDRADTLVRLSLQVWNSFQSLRIVPIRGLFQRLARVLRDAARVEGRQVELVMTGGETGVDRAVLDKAFEPLLHVVRNAVAHGIESPADRLKSGKPATGCVTLEARRDGNTLVIVVRDDGKGLDDEAIARKARQLEWVGLDETPSREQLHAFLFQPGFSTKSQANAISGRGVGMDVVAREVENLRGALELASEPGRGTQLTLRLPARLALEPALIVRVGGQPLAIPVSQVEHAQPFEPPRPGPDAPHQEARTDPAESSIADASLTYGGRAVPLVFAREILGIGHTSSAPWPKLALVRAGSELIGLVVDAIEGAEDLVIKPLGALLAGHPLVSGTSVSINGEVISVLHPSGLKRWLKNRMASPAGTLPSGAPDPLRVSAEERMAVLVVDDSISVRRGMARQLRSLGLEVHEVSNGLEALGRLRDSHIRLVLTDLQMPRLDGFALLSEIKRSAGSATIPVIVATTRCDPETRRRLFELGAQDVLSKPVNPQELARVAAPFLPGRRQG